jgi:hypothetical protein
MLSFVWILILIVLMIAIAAAIYRRKKPTQRAYVPTVLDLGVGDIVQYLDQDWSIEDKLTYTSYGYCWNEYLLQDGDERCWLSIEQDDDLEIGWLTQTTQLDIPDYLPPQLQFDQINYFLEESGNAQMTRTAAPDRPAESCSYWDYCDRNHILCIEKWNEELEVFVGRKLQAGELTILKGNGQRIYDV